MSCDANDASMASHDPTHYIAPLFDCLNLRNAMVPLMMPSLCDADTGFNGITQSKCHFAAHLNCHDLRNAMVPLMMLLALCDAGSQWCHMINENNDAIYDAVDIMQH